MKRNIKISILLLFGMFGGFFITPKVTTQTQVETAGQKFKNIKILNEMPAEQLGKVMNQMSASLGVNCSFCHVENDFAKEGNEHKDITREMLKMTFELNKRYFEGKTEITCNTCHNGKPIPQAAPDLFPKPREKRIIQPDNLPSAKTVLAKYKTAVGDKTKITSRHIKAKRLEPDGKTFEAEEIWQKGDKVAIQTVYPSKEYGDYVVKEVFDGTTAQKFGNGYKIELKADEMEQIKREAQFLTNNLESIYSRFEPTLLSRINGKEVYLVNAITSDNQLEHLYFDKDTGFLIRRASATKTVLGDFIYQVDYQNYKNFKGVKLPTVSKFAVPNIDWTRQILDVKNNVDIDDGKFR